MKEEEVHSIFDQFETDEETGEVIIPRATVGVAKDMEESETEKKGEDAGQEAGDGQSAETAEELPVLDLDFNFTEEDLVEVKDGKEEEDGLLQSIDAALEQEMAYAMGGDMEGLEEEKEEKKKNFWTKLPLWSRIAMITVASVFLLLLLLVGTKPGRKLIYRVAAGYIRGQMATPVPVTPLPTNIALPPEDEPTPELTGTPVSPELTPEITPPPPGAPRHEDYCYNVLLIGVESLPYFGTGERSDSMILVSINQKEKKIHLTSFMRDMYVQIEGYPAQKLNAAYAKGGAPLLIDTIEKNLKVKIDGYVKVNFDDFEWIINRLGGVEITLTAQEANYLRTTRYITNPAYRNVVAGTQVMNGNQVLGYCRVRYVPTSKGTSNDFGRTERQRDVLTKLFNKYKEKNIFTLLGILNDCLPKVTTDISADDMAKMLEMVIEERILTLDTMRIPVNGSFENAYVLIPGETKEQLVLATKFPQNIEALQNFIFATGEEGE